jgi:L-ascorbate metabolism protein UlaG (beta-lactamase superfamily)
MEWAFSPSLLPAPLSKIHFPEDGMLESVLSKLEWLGHECFLYNGPPVIYFSPYSLQKVRPADIILIGHEDLHHFSLPDIRKVWRPGTAIITDQSVGRMMEEPVAPLNPGEQTRIGDILIEAVPAYNLTTSFHPKSKGYLGFIVTVEGVRLYHAGDTDFIPEMRGLQVDIALLPVSGIGVMTAEEAAQAALALKPKVAIPMHYGPALPKVETPGAITDPMGDAESFRALLAGKIRVEILAKT